MKLDQKGIKSWKKSSKSHFSEYFGSRSIHWKFRRVELLIKYKERDNRKKLDHSIKKQSSKQALKRRSISVMWQWHWFSFSLRLAPSGCLPIQLRGQIIRHEAPQHRSGLMLTRDKFGREVGPHWYCVWSTIIARVAVLLLCILPQSSQRSTSPVERQRCWAGKRAGCRLGDDCDDSLAVGQHPAIEQLPR